ncbi:MAG: S-layer homology domain-containing protein, partial [Ruminococcaceae bacterium]|nr:S-layer homology domain-containing protein [Oscillospiraceae bacterium]
YAVDAMNWAVANGLITGTTETTLAPTATATRAQIATILMRYCRM